MSNLHPLINQACNALGTTPDANEFTILDGLLHDAIKRVRGVPPSFEYHVVETIVRTLGLSVSDTQNKQALEVARKAIASLRVQTIAVDITNDVPDLQLSD